MNVSGSSRVPSPAPPTQRGRVESAYERELLEFLRELGLDEVDRIRTQFTHRNRAGDGLSDYDVALNDLLQQARRLALFNQDRVLAQRIAAGEDVAVQRPMQRSGAVSQSNGDRTAGRRNGNQQGGEHAARTNTTATQRRGGWLSSMVGALFGSRPSNASSSAPMSKAVLVVCPTGHDCVVCQDPIYGKEIRAPCNHYYDIACVTKLFHAATTDETLFPPRCCGQNISFAQVQPHLSHELLTTFRQKRAEFSTLKRVYCSSPTCSRFLGPHLDVAKVYICPAPGCGRRTCAKCREKHNFGWMLAWMHACRPDASTSRILEVGRTAGWARCPGCSHMVERRQGCNHMTCRCRTEFCYRCGARWKACVCLYRGLPPRSPMLRTPTRVCSAIHRHFRSLYLVCLILALVSVLLLFFVLLISVWACRAVLTPPFIQPSCFQVRLKWKFRT